MIRIIIATVIVILSMVQTGFSQEDLENKSKETARKIDSITAAERLLMKEEIRKIEKDYNKDLITEEEFETRKKEVVSKHANKIKSEVDALEKELHTAVQKRVNDKLIKDKTEDQEEHKFIEINIGKTKGKKCVYDNKRTYSYMVYAFGLNNVMQDTDLNSIQDMPFYFGKSYFFEIGLNYKTRIFKENPVFYADYGLSVRYNNLRLKDNLYFESNDNITTLQTFAYDLKKSRFKNVQLVFPVMIELDFSKPEIKDEKKIFYRNRKFRFGFGGFAGINLKSKQILKYKLDGKNIRDKRKGDYNVNKFVYGVQGLVGYKDTSFYVKYDVNDLFHNNFNGQHNVSFGVRFDL